MFGTPEYPSADSPGAGLTIIQRSGTPKCCQAALALEQFSPLQRYEPVSDLLGGAVQCCTPVEHCRKLDMHLVQRVRSLRFSVDQSIGGVRSGAVQNDVVIVRKNGAGHTDDVELTLLDEPDE